MNIRLHGQGQKIVEFACDTLYPHKVYGITTSAFSEFDCLIITPSFSYIAIDEGGCAWIDYTPTWKRAILKLVYRDGELINAKEDGYPNACPNCGKDTSFFDEGNPIGAYCLHCNKLFDECGIEIPQIRK